MAQHMRAEDDATPERGGGILWFFGTLALAVAVGVVLRLFVIGVYCVPSGSMLETIQIGDLVLGEKVSLALRDPEPGEIVTFDSPLVEGETLVKRVIAVGGQTIDLVDGSVVVDGVTLDEPYVGDEPTQSLSDLSGSAGITYPYVVPDGCIWVMGDNRTNSKDSRYFGPVSVDDVTSIAVLIYWPLSDFGLI